MFTGLLGSERKKRGGTGETNGFEQMESSAVVEDY